MNRRIVVLVSIATLGLAGCGPRPTQQSGAPPSSPGTVSTVIDGVTGRSAVNAGQRARKTLEAVSTSERQQLDEVMP